MLFMVLQLGDLDRFTSSRIARGTASSNVSSPIIQWGNTERSPILNDVNALKFIIHHANLQFSVKDVDHIADSSVLIGTNQRTNHDKD